MITVQLVPHPVLTPLQWVSKLVWAQMTFAANAATKSDNSNTYDYQSTTIGASYNMGNGAVIGVYQNTGDNDKDADYDYEQTAASITYAIAPGLSAAITVTDTEWLATQV